MKAEDILNKVENEHFIDLYIVSINVEVNDNIYDSDFYRNTSFSKALTVFLNVVEEFKKNLKEDAHAISVEIIKETIESNNRSYKTAIHASRMDDWSIQFDDTSAFN